MIDKAYRDLARLERQNEELRHRSLSIKETSTCESSAEDERLNKVIKEEAPDAFKEQEAQGSGKGMASR